MKKTSVLVLIGWLLAACGGPVPDIDVVDAYDWGSVPKGDLAVADLAVRNIGEAPLTVQGVSTSCGCTTATLSPMTIPPGGEARLHVEYDTGLHEADVGPMKRSVFISSDDPDEDDVQIRFAVFVEASGS